MFIRYMADTSDTDASLKALEYLHSLLRIAPVRVVSMTAPAMGKIWVHYASLLITPMMGEFANVVCCSPARWSFEQAVPMPARNGTVPIAKHTVELYTRGVRNVLIATKHPQSQDQITAAAKYEAMVVDSEELRMGWEMNGRPGALVIPIPVMDHDAVRAAVLG